MNTNPISRTRQIVALSFVLAFFLCVLGMTTILALTSGADLLAVGASQPTTPTVSVEALCAQLAYTSHAPPTSAIGQAQQRRYQACLDAYNTRLTPKPKSARQLTLAAPHTIVARTVVVPRTPAGAGTIVDNPGSPDGPLFVARSLWTFETQGKTYEVYTGARREEGPPQPTDSMQGYIHVWVWDTASGSPLDEGSYLELPVKKGPLRIIGAQGQQLVLQTDDGMKYYFDLPTRALVAALNTPTPLGRPTQPPYP